MYDNKNTSLILALSSWDILVCRLKWDDPEISYTQTTYSRYQHIISLESPKILILLIEKSKSLTTIENKSRKNWSKSYL